MKGWERVVGGTMFAIIVSLVAFSWTTLAAGVSDLDQFTQRTRERLAIVETRGTDQNRRLERIENKLDQLLELQRQERAR